MPGPINNSISIFVDNRKDESVNPEKNTAVFKSRKGKIQKTNTNYTDVANHRQKPKVKAKNKAVDYDIKSVGGLKNFKAKLEAAIATKPKKTGMISSKRSQEATSNKQQPQTEKPTISKQQDVSTQPTTINSSVAADGQTKIPTAPPVPPIAEHKNNNSLKASVNYQRKNNWDEIPIPEQEKPSHATTKETTPKTKKTQAVMSELSKVLARRKKT